MCAHFQSDVTGPQNRTKSKVFFQRKMEMRKSSIVKASDTSKSKSSIPNPQIKRGQRILTEKPFAFVLKSKYRLERCDNCLEA